MIAIKSIVAMLITLIVIWLLFGLLGYIPLHRAMYYTDVLGHPGCIVLTLMVGVPCAIWVAIEINLDKT